ncbi:tetratricopeptide repeat protein [bacterium]|nr:tetratricopeptide repeat protein [bacterium]
MLRARKHIKKREIQEDRLSVYYRHTSKFLRTHTRNVQIGLFAVVVVLVVMMLMARSKREAEKTAASQLGIAENYLYLNQPAIALTEFEQIAKTFSGTDAAGRAVFHMATIYSQRLDYDNAETYYREYLAKYKNDPLYEAAAMAGIAACAESRDQFEDAARWYDKAWKIDKHAFNAVFYLENAGMNYRLAGNTERARTVYQTIIDDYPDSPVTGKAEYLMGSL